MVNDDDDADTSSELSKTGDMQVASKRKLQDMQNKNPCYTEMKAAYACLDKNSSAPQICSNYFNNYNQCQKFWNEVYRERRNKGIFPHMPEQDERKRIMKEKFGAAPS